MQTVTIPGVRADLEWTSSGIVDKRFRRLLRPRQGAAALLEALRSGTDDLVALRDALKVSPEDLYRLLYAVARDLYLDLPVLDAYDALRRWQPQPPPADVVPERVDGEPFLCTGCGKCCEYTDIGPIRGHEVERIGATVADFGDRVVQLAEDIFVLPPGDVRACHYLQADNLCAIHAAHGPDCKPLVCIQAPYRFTVVDDEVKVTLDLECWEIEESVAKGQQDPAGAREDMLAVWRREPIVEVVPPVRLLDAFHPLDDATYARLGDLVAAGLQRSADPRPALREAWAAVRPDPPSFLAFAPWRERFGADFAAVGPDQRAELQALLTGIIDAWVDGAAPWRRPLAAVLRSGIEALYRQPPDALADDRVRRLLARAVTSSLAGWNVVKKDNLEYGLVHLYWRTHIAVAALHEHPVVDALVATSKLQKDQRFGELVRIHLVRLRELMLAEA